MANKNKHVIIGYFPSKEAATEAADQLKRSDAASDDVKLGGMGILTWENGKIKRRARSAIGPAAPAPNITRSWARPPASSPAA